MPRTTPSESHARPSRAIDDFIAADFPNTQRDLATLVRFESVSTDLSRAGAVRACCEYLVKQFGEIGLSAKLLETDGHPLVFAQWVAGDDAPSVLVYCHYDVQPADPSEGWHSDPFEATICDGKVFGRGVIDCKGHIAIHLAALRAMLACRGTIPINLSLLFEGEEEIGGPHFRDAVNEHLSELSPDLIVISDTPMYSAEVPAITTSLRGIVAWEITVHGPDADLHSGLYGGVVQNPIDALARILAALQDDAGRVLVPGFYDGVNNLDPVQSVGLSNLEYDEPATAASIGVSSLRHDPERSALECLWYRPSIDCNGIYGGYEGEGRKTIIPKSASAKLSARLVAGQDPQRIARLVATFINSVAPTGVRVMVTFQGGSPAISAPVDHPAIATAKRILEEVFGGKVALIGLGGSISAASVFDQVFSAPQVMLGFGLPSDGIHGPNEHVDLSRLEKGVVTVARFYDELV